MPSGSVCITILSQRCHSSCKPHYSLPFPSTAQVTTPSQLVGLTIGPAFLSAAIYLCLGRIIVVYGQHISRLKPRSYTIIFMACDFISLLLQSAGGAMASIADTQPDTDRGVNVMIAGLIVQVVSLTVFAVLCADFAFQSRRRWNEREVKYFGLRQTFFFKAFLFGKSSCSTSSPSLELRGMI